jgi:2'-5' RNA ligase
MVEELSVWLLPRQADRESLVEIINDLAKRHSSPRFVPHVTIAGPLTASASQVSRKLEELACQMQPFDVLTTVVMHSNSRFKAVFVGLAPHDRFRIMRSDLAQAWPEIRETEFQPHISLIYKQMPEREREAIVASLTPQLSYSFDEVAIVAPGGKGKDWLDVRSWRVLKAFKLDSGTR